MIDKEVLNFSGKDTENLVLVWAKIPGYAPWPGFLQVPPDNAPRKPRKVSEENPFRWVYFLETHNYSWVECDRLVRINSNNLVDIKPDRKSKSLASWKRAVTAALDFLDRKMNKYDIIPYSPKSPKCKKADKSNSSLCESSSEYIETSSVKKRKKEIIEMGPPISKKSKKQNGAKYFPSTSDCKNKSMPAPKRQNDFSSDSDNQNSIDRDLMPPPNKIRKHTQQYAEIAKKEPLNRVYGFMCLNFRTCAMIRNMLCAGHKITFWNVETDDLVVYKMLEEFAEDTKGSIKLFREYGDFIGVTDIILMYNEDIKETLNAHKMLKLDQPITELIGGKSYVEFTTMDHSYSQEFSKMFDQKGVRYLEAQLQGNTRDFVKGELVVLTCGNKALFNDIKSVFKSTGKEAFFLGAKIGKACNGNAIFQAFRGSLVAGYTEALGMANRCGIGPETFAHITGHSDLDSTFLYNKGKFIMENDYTHRVEEEIGSFQKDVKMGLELSNRIGINVPMASKAHEIIKQARRVGYLKEDAACIYRTIT